MPDTAPRKGNKGSQAMSLASKTQSIMTTSSTDRSHSSTNLGEGAHQDRGWVFRCQILPFSTLLLGRVLRWQSSHGLKPVELLTTSQLLRTWLDPTEGSISHLIFHWTTTKTYLNLN